MTPEDSILLNKLNAFMVQSDPTEPFTQAKTICTAFKYARNYILEHDMESEHKVKVFE